MAKKIEKNKEVVAMANKVTIEGRVTKVLYASDKVASYSIDNTIPSPKNKDKVIHTYVTVKEFQPKLQYEVGDIITVTGALGTDTYEKDGRKYYNVCVVGEIGGENDEIPFN